MNGGAESAGKRGRTTRAARSALEGGQRSLVRRARWWEDCEVDLVGVLGTGGRDWPRWGEMGAGDGGGNGTGGTVAVVTDDAVLVAVEE